MRRAACLLAFPALLLTGASLSKDLRPEHALNRLAFGPHPGDVDRVRKMGVAKWIDQQLHPEQIARIRSSPNGSSLSGRRRWTWCRPRSIARSTRIPSSKKCSSISGSTTSTCSPAKGRSAACCRLRARCDPPARARQVPRYAARHRSTSRDAVLPGQLAIRSAADGDRAGVAPEAAKRTRGLNENYARELMELHTLGVDGGYTQQDVIEVARASPAGRSIARRRTRQFRFAPACTTAARRSSSATRSPPGGGERGRPGGDRHPGAAPVDGALHLAQARRSGSSPTSRRRRWSTAWRRHSPKPAATCAR